MSPAPSRPNRAEPRGQTTLHHRAAGAVNPAPPAARVVALAPIGGSRCPGTLTDMRIIGMETVSGLPDATGGTVLPSDCGQARTDDEAGGEITGTMAVPATSPTPPMGPSMALREHRRGGQAQSPPYPADPSTAADRHPATSPAAASLPLRAGRGYQDPRRRLRRLRRARGLRRSGADRRHDHLHRVGSGPPERDHRSVPQPAHGPAGRARRSHSGRPGPE